MLQIRIHGRGGQGVVTAVDVLSVAAFLEDKHALPVEDMIIDLIDEPVLADTERLASGEARILLFLMTGRRSPEEISAKLSAEKSNGEAFIRKIIVRNQQGQGCQPRILQCAVSTRSALDGSSVDLRRR
jgi:hypothetical protein